MHKHFILTILSISVLTACNNDSSDTGKNETKPPNTCIETGAYACKTGETEPLYPFQWALNYQKSFFSAYKDIWKDPTDPENYDLNVESVHQQGIKGQGIKIMVLDDGLEINHEDLSANIDKTMLYNFLDKTNDPTPANNAANIKTAHGTNVAGIIAAAQNAKGVMGIAPRATLGGALIVGLPLEMSTIANFMEAMGGANFSKNTDIFNASFGANPLAPETYDTETGKEILYRSFPNLRANKGAIYIKATGNSFIHTDDGRICPDQFKGILSCENPAHDNSTLETTVINVAAANARGIKATYSNAGAVNWITGLGGEHSTNGAFGESLGKDEDGETKLSAYNGPYIFSTDLQGCQRGYSRSQLDKDDPQTLFAQGLSTFKEVKNNLLCNYSHMNGTSAATPTVTGVTALILQTNPDLTWRDVREILRKSSRVIDQNYSTRIKANRLVDLTTGKFLTDSSNKDAIKDGATQVPLEFGWQTNGAGIQHSNWYGFGLVDAAAAVKLAKTYKAGTFKSELKLPSFSTAFPDVGQLSYSKVTKLGTIALNQTGLIDQFQLRVSGPLCVGSVGFFVKSPSGVISALSIPYNIYYQADIDQASNFGLGSYAFYGEKPQGSWEIYAVSGDKGNCKSEITATQPLKIEYRILPQVS